MTTYLKRLKLKNFKTFNEIQVDFNNLNVIIGINASGKSNLISIFKFLRDIVNFGLENAISLQGGKEYLLNSKTGIHENFVVELDIAHTDHIIEMSLESRKEKIRDFNLDLNEDDIKTKNLYIKTTLTKYCFEIQFHEGKKFSIINDNLTTHGEVFLADINKSEKQLKLKNKKNFGNIEFCSCYEKEQLNFKLSGNLQDQFINFLSDDFSPRHPVKIPPNSLILENPHFFIEAFVIDSLLKKLAIFDIDPKLSKRGISISGKIELEEDGNNLALIMKNIIQDEKKSKEFFDIVNDFLPFVEAFNVDVYAGKNLILKMKEVYNNDYWPASFLSDGTVNIISLIVAANFETRYLTIFEEPEKNIHPMLVSKLLHLFKDASEKNQIILTTHNPEFVKHTDIRDLIFINRDKDGFSKIVKPNKLKKVKIFLKSELGLEELFIRNLIGE
jgi:predicted ATPase